jgi:hypothetical protein
MSIIHLWNDSDRGKWKFSERKHVVVPLYRSADKSLARPTPQCILFDGKNISFDASLVIYIYISY